LRRLLTSIPFFSLLPPAIIHSENCTFKNGHPHSQPPAASTPLRRSNRFHQPRHQTALPTLQIVGHSFVISAAERRFFANLHRKTRLGVPASLPLLPHHPRSFRELSSRGGIIGGCFGHSVLHHQNWRASHVRHRRLGFRAARAPRLIRLTDTPRKIQTC
jgi:hypothetical protein